MIAINWFGLSFSLPVATVGVAVYERSAELPRRIRTNDHRTVLKRGDDDTRIYHIGRNAPITLQAADIALGSPPDDIPRILIEMSFADALRNAKFDTHFRHVGGLASRPGRASSRPAVFELREGFAFRAFSFREDAPEDVRWGLVLNYLTSQRFVISLAHPVLRKYSLNKRVVRLEEPHEGGSSGLLTAFGDDYLVIAHGDGSSTRESPSAWTAQCRKDVLFDFVAATESRKESTAVSVELQRASMAINANGRINVSLARDQITEVQRLLLSSDLTQFRIVSRGDGPITRVTTEPLAIGD
jgi:hypothetical protein